MSAAEVGFGDEVDDPMGGWVLVVPVPVFEGFDKVEAEGKEGVFEFVAGDGFGDFLFSGGGACSVGGKGVSWMQAFREGGLLLFRKTYIW